MLWNWYTIDSCFISSTWRITSNGVFAGSCIGVILLVMSLEMLRRAVKEYDRYLIRKHLSSAVAAPASPSPAGSVQGDGSSNKAVGAAAVVAACAPQTFRPNIFEQAIRALLHMLQFAVAYFVML